MQSKALCSLKIVLDSLFIIPAELLWQIIPPCCSTMEHFLCECLGNRSLLHPPGFAILVNTLLIFYLFECDFLQLFYSSQFVFYLFECDFLQFFYSLQFVFTHFGCAGTSLLYTSTIGGSHYHSILHEWYLRRDIFLASFSIWLRISGLAGFYLWTLAGTPYTHSDLVWSLQNCSTLLTNLDKNTALSTIFKLIPDQNPEGSGLSSQIGCDLYVWDQSEKFGGHLMEVKLNVVCAEIGRNIPIDLLNTV